ncbi:MAG: tetratricopeptide repeat protein [Muribaculaceae bacterium]|nr:tetratricopeptide repeat protein [Muribaculaceae bacterium]
MEEMQSIDYIKQAFDLKESKLYKPAIEKLYKALEIEVDNIEILSQIGELYFLLNNYTRANQYFEKVLQINPSHENSLKLTRTIKEREGDWNRVLELSQKLFDSYQNSENLKSLIKALIKLKLFVEIDKYKESEFFTDDVKSECASSYYENGETEQAKELLSQCNQDDEEVLLLCGKIKFDENDFDGAREIFSRIGKNSINPEILNYLGLFDLENMDFIEAIKNFSKAANLDKSNAKYYYNLANAYFYNGWTEEAQKAYAKALYIAPDNLDYRYSLAYLYFDKKDFVKAQKETDAILAIKSEHPQARVLRALLLAKNNDFIGAQKILEENLEKGFNDDFTKISLSKIYTELNMFNKAEELVNSVISANSDNLNYLSDLAEIHIKEKNYDKALELAQKILEINPNYILGCILGARTALLKEDLSTAKEYAQDAISLDINCSDGYYYLALVREKENDLDEAIECMKRAILYDLNNAEYYKTMSDFYKKKEDYKTALEYISEAQNLDDSNEYKFLYSELVKLNRKVKK